VPAQLPGLSDYATKIWAHLISQYQAPRHTQHAQASFYPGKPPLISPAAGLCCIGRIAIFANQAVRDFAAGQAFNSTQALADTLKLAVSFENAGWDPATTPSEPQGDALATAQSLLAKYGSQLQCSCPAM
jgi:hypothetical protein